MNGLRATRKLWTSLPALERLDVRITPSAFSAAATLAAGLPAQFGRMSVAPAGQVVASPVPSPVRDQPPFHGIIATNPVHFTAPTAQDDSMAVRNETTGVEPQAQVVASPVPKPVNNQPPFHGIIATNPVHFTGV
jgi:hypothetical protein